MSKTLRVSAVQMDCEVGNRENNLNKAAQLVKKAVQEGAKLVLLPEFMPSGYILTEEIWDYAETIEGTSVNWLQETAKEHNIYLGFTFLEADGEDFFNSFVLSGSEGKLLGRVRKNPPASIEAYFYTGGTDKHVIETDIGKIGVGICYENLLHNQMCYLYDENVDLLLSPSAAGRPKPFIFGDVRRFEQMLIKSRSIFAKTLKVPVIMANRAGKLETELPGNLTYLKSSFPGLSSIVDSDGTLKAELNDEEDIIVADITINRHHEPKQGQPKCYSKSWAVPVPWYAFIWPLTQKWGERSYRNNLKRKEKALSISKTSNKALERNI